MKKEKKMRIEKILDTLAKKSFIEIEPICNECISDVVYCVVDVFPSAHFDTFQIEDGLYCLRISV